ncbi:MAG: OsmC family peroxiredoxin [Thermomicrobiales bacterium]
MAVERSATAVWDGDLLNGSGVVNTGTGVITDQPVSWAARTEDPGGKTSPEELMAVAHAACYAMAFSHVLGTAGNPPERLEVTAKVGFGPKDGGGMEVKYSNLSVSGRVPGLDQGGFEEAAKQGEAGCPISNALRGNIPITVEATLEA